MKLIELQRWREEYEKIWKERDVEDKEEQCKEEEELLRVKKINQALKGTFEGRMSMVYLDRNERCTLSLNDLEAILVYAGIRLSDFPEEVIK